MAVKDWHKSESAVGIGELVGLGVDFTVGVHGDGSDHLILDGAGIAAGLYLGDGVDDLHAGGHLSKGGVLHVQMPGSFMHDDELASGGVGGGGTGHAENAALVLQVVLEAVEEEHALDAVAGAAHAGALGAAALDHEAGDDAMKDQAVVVALVCQGDEVIDTLGRLLGVQLAGDDAAGLHGDGESRIHLDCSFTWILYCGP